MVKVFLKKNWSESFIFGDTSPGVFIGRKDELESLKFALLNNDSGAILVSAVRGVGKTSFVHKALSEMGNSVHPIFVNAGHVLSSLKSEDLPKKELLTSLIRASYFAFKDDKEIKEIYYKAVGSFKKYKINDESNEVLENKELNLNKEFNFRNLIVFVGAILTVLGISVDNIFLKILACLGLISIPMSLSWKKSWTTKVKNSFGEETFVENSIDYLELLFENWLKNKKKKKLVFIIDELDKVDDGKAFSLIKEYKNLFSRSFAHFIFIAGPDAYQLTKENRELKAAAGGIFPTLFTHSYYLPLPTTKELKGYLREVFQDELGSEQKDLMGYLLFHAKNDFFNLKNLINDLLLLEDGVAFLDTDHIKNIDIQYRRSTKIYDYASMFCEKNSYRVKKYWQANSILQKDVFDFLNKNIGFSFSVIEEDCIYPIKELLKFLQRIGSITKINELQIEESGVKKTKKTFGWTGTYKDIDSPEYLFDEEKKFLAEFNQLIKVANDLDDLPDGKFSNFKTIVKGRDGHNLSGVSLYETYENYKVLEQNITNPKKRMGVLLEDVKTATEDIFTQTSEVNKKLLIIINKIVELKLNNKKNLFVNQTFSQRPSSFSVCTSFSTVFGKLEHSILGTTNGKKEIILVKDFINFEEIQDGLSKLHRNKNLLVINILTSNVKYPNHPVIYKDSIGRKRQKGMVVKNFYNYQLNSDFRNIKKIINRIRQHFQYS